MMNPNEPQPTGIVILATIGLLIASTFAIKLIHGLLSKLPEAMSVAHWCMI